MSQPVQRCFQFMSDLHLELGQQYDAFDFPAVAPYLTERYQRVFLVLGNNEFHGMDHATGISTAKKLENEPLLDGKLTLLHRTRSDVDHGQTVVSVLGCTLWSRIRDDAADQVRSKVKDFQSIQGWTVERHNAEHEADVQWLKNEIGLIARDEPNNVVIVITHHAPAIQEASRPEYMASPITGAFATDLLPSGDWGRVEYWIYGHTHFSTEFEKGSVTVVSNQRGYILPGTNIHIGGKGDTGRREFSAEKVIRIDKGAT
ncbi:hypothetical protein SODALDRAFT_339161 [Sodiomyces alkalinus F11]|uniref:Calcineurin-like phosphoesterase domain-containing protein n=1 Tax=Sodiomyces alkalinus (strain CBS 110278 / VKM F-3762 / F11) TaxID=1314773 RepID=A0A3N2PZ68_SODAK|nr:hypothetical protein SODALDRAFT_339161 [Sodiomyces alkalinus F11]ROT39718.1 hypothetical protein SODALDRAFT_339161 [Sodiomyces alkalinus F11]